MRGMQVMATKQERRELLGGAHWARDAASVDLAALYVLEDGDVHVLRCRCGFDECAAAEQAPGGETLEDTLHVVGGDAVALGHPGRRHRPARAQQPERDALQALVGSQRPIERLIGGRNEGVPAARKVDVADAALASERGDHFGGIVERALGDLLGGEVAEIVQDSRQLVGVAGPTLGRRLLKLSLDRGDDVGAQRPGGDAPRLAHGDGVTASLLGVAGVQIRPVPRQQQRVYERRRQRGVDVPRPHLAVVEALEQTPRPWNVEGVVEALAQRLGHQGKVGLAAHGLEQRIGFQPLQVRWRPLATIRAWDEQRAHGRVTEAGAEERRADQRFAEEHVELLGGDERWQALGRWRHLAGRERQ